MKELAEKTVRGLTRYLKMIIIIAVVVVAGGYYYGTIGLVPGPDGTMEPKVATLRDYSKVHQEGRETGIKEGYTAGYTNGKKAGVTEVATKPWYSRVFNPKGE